MGVCGRVAGAWVVVAAAVVVVAAGSTVPKRGVNEIEAFVKRLEYEARERDGGRYTVEGLGGVEGLVEVNLNLLPDEVIVKEIEEGLDEEFALVDTSQGEKEEEGTGGRKNNTNNMESRQRSLIYQGVYLPDARFNAFADGVMINMVAEMKRKEMDPLYFRVFQRGIIEHVPLSSSTTPSTSTSSTFTTTTTTAASTSRRGRQRGEAIGGGVIRGLTNVRRFGNAEVQVAGNTTLVRTHHVFGPLYLELLFDTEMGVRAVNSTLGSLAGHAVTHLNQTDPAFIDFIIDSPAAYEIQLVGSKSERYKRLSLSAMTRLFKPTGRLERRLRGAFTRARRRRIPDVRKRRRGGRGGRGGRRGSGGGDSDGEV
ncbi:uncharacterized protein LOC123519941 isoform X2 [Portunus trituberculatus]|uniref:uncharacterized protein LOC123519941 isoform X2 n=1 Tax=Portunus trituberculatus TaxID=210409 RepID=UPI001E1CFC81|nr:uncharacterized protein LOC123519941 isoform X2 [Portunus trituberculatus]